VTGHTEPSRLQFPCGIELHLRVLGDDSDVLQEKALRAAAEGKRPTADLDDAVT
jgi:hypothetical protein